MKKLLLIVTIAVTALHLQAQKLDKAKDYLKNNKLEQAKTEIDNFVNVEKNKTNSDAWYTKAKVYLAIAGDAAMKANVPEAKNIAFESLKTYIDLESQKKDSATRNVQLTLEGNAPFGDLYKGFSADAATFYNAGNFADAYTNFAKSLDVFDYIVAKKLIAAAFDTNTCLYTGISAEKANKPDEAAQYYGRIAERKIKSEGFIEIYKWLADHYGKKGDITNAYKYTALGREVYPGDQFWDAYDIDLVKEKGTKEDLFKKYESVIAANPGNHIFPFNYAVELFQAGYDPDITKRPANSKELLAKSVDNLKKSLAIKADYANANFLLGQIIYNEGVDLVNENKKIRPPQGGKLKPEELKKKEDYRKQIAAKFAEALPYFEKVEQAYGSQGKLKMEEKQTLKDAYDLIITIYENSDNKDKVNEYTDKFNSVDKKH